MFSNLKRTVLVIFAVILALYILSDLFGSVFPLLAEKE